jgi:hypothetical protein
LLSTAISTTVSAMLGFHISVYRLPDGGGAPATWESVEGARLAVWQTGLGGLDWLDELARDGKAINLGVRTLCGRFTTQAAHVLPRIADGPPGARPIWSFGPYDILTEKWDGRTVIDRDAAAACRPDEWLLIEAWDES